MRDCLILSHGAATNRDAPLLRSIDDAFKGSQVEVIRVNLPFREARQNGVPGADDAERDREGLRVVVERQSTKGCRVFLGGHSYGGRQSLIIAAANPGLVNGLLLLSYPLHPPRRADPLRTEEFPNLHTPALFIHGERDPFGSIDELSEALSVIPARHKLIAISGTGHELTLLGASGVAEVSTRIFEEFRLFWPE